MKNDLILAGVGGQGILTLSAILGEAALREGLHLKQSEVHGMAQRGGAVVSHFRLSDEPIASDLIPHGGADLIVSLEPLEALRYLPWLNKSGWLISSVDPVENIPDYPALEETTGKLEELSRKLLVEAQKIGRENDLARGANTAVLGAAAHFLELPEAAIENAIKNYFSKKGDAIVRKNLSIFYDGLELADADSEATG